MRKSSTSFLALVCALGFAPRPVRAQVSIGAKGVVTRTEIQSTEIDYYNRHRSSGGSLLFPRWFFGWGGVVEVGLLRSFSLRLDPTFVSSGTEHCHRSCQELEIPFIEIPVVLKASHRAGSQAQVYALGGPYLGFALGKGTAEDFYLLRTYPNVDYYERKENWSHFNFGLQFGGGVGWTIGRAVVFTEAVYKLGLRDIYNDPPDPLENKYDDKTRAFEWNWGVTFQVSRGKRVPTK